MTDSENQGITAANFDIADFMPYRLAVAARAFSEEIAAIYREKFGLSIPEWRVLAHLMKEGKASVRDIEARVTMEKSKVSRAADRLRERGLLTKRADTVDRRLVHIELTQEGEALMAELIPMVIALQKDVEARLGEDFEGLDRALTRILQGDVS
ncbi:MarR family winged helix-turn-helix transcriptional regulator [Cognatishimia sp.]|uniref:MarR family winged helix-turn-helix transcriptional regulator n=1 Tax=Cognatishimia sp. TaxID=2211648 RepID=UPI0035195935